MRAEKLRVAVMVGVGKRLAVLAVSAIALLVASNFESSKQEARNLAEAGLRDDNSKIQEIEAYLESAKKAQESQSLLVGKTNNYKGIDRNFLTDSLDTLKSRYMIIDLSMRMGPTSILPEKEMQKNSLDIEHSLISINFSGLTDELLLSFTDNLLKIIPGYVSVDALQIERKRLIDDSVLNEVANEKYLPLVSGTLSFHWMVPKAKTKEAGNAAPPSN